MVSGKNAFAPIGVALCLLILGVTGASLAAAAPQANQDNSILVWLDKRHPIVKLALAAMSARGYDTSPYRLVMFRKTEAHYSLTFYPSLARDAKRGAAARSGGRNPWFR